MAARLLAGGRLRSAAAVVAPRITPFAPHAGRRCPLAPALHAPTAPAGLLAPRAPAPLRRAPELGARSVKIPPFFTAGGAHSDGEKAGVGDRRRTEEKAKDVAVGGRTKLVPFSSGAHSDGEKPGKAADGEDVAAGGRTKLAPFSAGGTHSDGEKAADGEDVATGGHGGKAATAGEPGSGEVAKVDAVAATNYCRFDDQLKEFLANAEARTRLLVSNLFENSDKREDAPDGMNKSRSSPKDPADSNDAIHSDAVDRLANGKSAKPGGKRKNIKPKTCAAKDAAIDLGKNTGAEMDAKPKTSAAAAKDAATAIDRSAKGKNTGAEKEDKTEGSAVLGHGTTKPADEVDATKAARDPSHNHDDSQPEAKNAPSAAVPADDKDAFAAAIFSNNGDGDEAKNGATGITLSADTTNAACEDNIDSHDGKLAKDGAGPERKKAPAQKDASEWETVKGMISNLGEETRNGRITQTMVLIFMMAAQLIAIASFMVFYGSSIAIERAHSKMVELAKDQRTGQMVLDVFKSFFSSMWKESKGVAIIGAEAVGNGAVAVGTAVGNGAAAVGAAVGQGATAVGNGAAAAWNAVAFWRRWGQEEEEELEEEEEEEERWSWH